MSQFKKIFKRIFNPDGKNTMDKDQGIIDFLILNGAMEVAGIDSSNGEFLYQFTPKLKEVMPELYNEHLNHVNSHIMTLWERGYLHIDFLEDNPIVNLTEKAMEPDEIAKLSQDEQWSINEIRRLIIGKEL